VFAVDDGLLLPTRCHALLQLHRQCREMVLSGATVREDRRALLVARPRRNEGHAPVNFAVGTTDRLSCTAEVEIRVSRVTDRPPAVIPLKVSDSLGFLGFLCHGNCAHAWRIRKVVQRAILHMVRELCAAIRVSVRRDGTAHRTNEQGHGFWNRRLRILCARRAFLRVL